MVDIDIDDIAGLDSAALEDTVACGNPVVDLLLVLEDTGGLVAPEITDGLIVFSAIEFEGVLVELVGLTVDDTVLTRD